MSQGNTADESQLINQRALPTLIAACFKPSEVFYLMEQGKSDFKYLQAFLKKLQSKDTNTEDQAAAILFLQ